MRKNNLPTGAKLFKMELSYVGTPFQGWQTQPNGFGVQDYIDRALSVLLREDIKTIGASRTDSGVHAEHQVVSFVANHPIEPVKFIRGLNALTPPQISVYKLVEADPFFHPIYSSQGKIYRYRLWRGRYANPFLTQFSWHMNKDIDIELMKSEASYFLGKHDFSSFCASDSTAISKYREIKEIFVDDRDDLVDVWVAGRGFLKQMVRTMVGTLVEIATGKMTSASIAGILASCDRKCAGITAPALGLCLVKVLYEDYPSCKTMIGRGERGYCMAFYESLE